ncbi:MAG: hypothetical protein UT63_C0063G0021 [Candidatus Gottesmanbacteria bacterium GW2011_GWC2_39_8]|uniref:LTD domain-containing protein n=1 Tax=Candidatus Gottesmanbacteria bacterium GW2011_GWC2_39_8 TaxID=1618450 RepID=A0A0G0PUY8_9BACT|nr:MAG: hypothetical protein UT63_C0063G0021 [Candidatus Gottesmanbacteria bacterium GW2011_GWC2_39_8]
MLKLNLKVFLITIMVGLTVEMVAGVTYSFFSASTENSGNTFTTGTWSSVQTGGVVINEFMPEPSDTSAHDWVELYNSSSNPVDISGWSLWDSGNSTAMATIGNNVILNNNIYMVVDVGVRLSQNSDTVTLKNIGRNSIDTKSYTQSDYQVGVSIGRETDGSDVWKKCVTPSSGATNNGAC